MGSRDTGSQNHGDLTWAEGPPWLQRDSEATEVIVAQRVFPLGPGDPTHVGGYVLTGRLKSGSDASGVYVGHRAARQSGAPAGSVTHPFVVKTVRNDCSAAARARFEREARCMRRIRSPRLARLVDSGVAGNWLYLVQEYVPGVTLSDLIKRASPLPAREGLRVALELLEAIADVHEADVVHRDVKPLNVVIGNNRVTLVDLGIAKHATDGGVTTTEQICGTLRYMSPEQAVGDAPGKPSDIFSWGLTVAEALQGYHPIDPGHRLLSDWSAYRRALHRCRPDLTHVPPAVQPWIARALAAAPEHRPTVHELLAGLEPLHSPASSPSGTLLISSRQGARSRSLRKTVTRWRDVILEAAESRIADRPAWFAASLAVAALLGAPAGVVVRVIWTTAMGN